MKDAIGNELKIGDPVFVKIGLEWVQGHIVKIQNGGIAVTGIPKDKNSPVGVTPDALILEVAMGFQMAPGSNQPGVVKIAAPNAVDQIVQSSIVQA